MYNNKNNSRYRRRGGFNNRRNRFRGSNRPEKKLDWKLFVKKAKPTAEVAYKPSRRYRDMNLHPKLIRSLDARGYKNPTEIQDKTIDHSLKGENILGIANTGTGKTGAFLIPIIDRLLMGENKSQTLIVLPTRELANQVEKEFLAIAQAFRLYSVCLTGGTSIRRSLDRLSKFNHIIIGTPGRLIDMVKRNALKLENVETLVLDEFDRMLDMGFVKDVRFLSSQMKQVKQTMLFSATIDRKLKPIVDEILKNPFEAMVDSGTQASDNVEQDVIRLKDGENKFEKLSQMINYPDYDKVLIFAETKRAVDKLNHGFRKVGIRSDLIHGNKSQRAREVALDKFKKGKVQVLVATDVAARGLDIKGVSHVINYETPSDYESYIHRIGRTGRAGQKGYAYTFVA